jgi:DNA-directed RNA polymerase subunit RPC12/RpoP
MKWVEKDTQACFPVYVCSKCGAEILVFDAVELPNHCKNCKEVDEE